MIKIEIYLKSRKKPIELFFENKTAASKLYTMLETDSVQIIRVGPLMFSKSEFAYLIEKIK